MDDKTEAQPPSADWTLRERMIEALSLQDGVTNTQIVDIVIELVKPGADASAADCGPARPMVTQDEFDSVSSANGRLRAALSTLAQVNRAQASMIEDVFVERGIAK